MFTTTTTTTQRPAPPLLCLRTDFRCEVSPGVFQCIPRLHLCDEQKDCVDGADEEEDGCGSTLFCWTGGNTNRNR